MCHAGILRHGSGSLAARQRRVPVQHPFSSGLCRSDFPDTPLLFPRRDVRKRKFGPALQMVQIHTSVPALEQLSINWSYCCVIQLIAFVDSCLSIASVTSAKTATERLSSTTGIGSDTMTR